MKISTLIVKKYFFPGCPFQGRCSDGQRPAPVEMGHLLSARGWLGRHQGPLLGRRWPPTSQGLPGRWRRRRLRGRWLRWGEACGFWASTVPPGGGNALLQIGAPFSDPEAAMTARRCFKNIHPILNGSALNIDAHFTFFDNHFSGEHETQKFHESLQ